MWSCSAEGWGLAMRVRRIFLHERITPVNVWGSESQSEFCFSIYQEPQALTPALQMLKDTWICMMIKWYIKVKDSSGGRLIMNILLQIHQSIHQLSRYKFLKPHNLLVTLNKKKEKRIKKGFIKFNQEDYHSHLHHFLTATLISPLSSSTCFISLLAHPTPLSNLPP